MPVRFCVQQKRCLARRTLPRQACAEQSEKGRFLGAGLPVGVGP